jgi:nitroreductase
VDVLEAIRSRRSIRKFQNKEVPDDMIETILTAGIWAPSGMDNQPWRFAVIRDKKLKAEIGKETIHTDIVNNVPVIIPVFLDHNVTFDTIKDAQSMGACLQNMWLALHGLGLGATWIGQILKNKEAVRKICGAPEKYELMAVFAIGYPAESGGQGERKGLKEVVFLRK